MFKLSRIKIRESEENAPVSIEYIVEKHEDSNTELFWPCHVNVLLILLSKEILCQHHEMINIIHINSLYHASCPVYNKDIMKLLTAIFFVRREIPAVRPTITSKFMVNTDMLAAFKR